MFLALIIPGNIEEILKITNRQGNMAWNGIFLDLYNKRNLFYLSLLLLFFSYYNLIFVFGFLYLFYNTYNKWKPYFHFIIN